MASQPPPHHVQQAAAIVQQWVENEEAAGREQARLAALSPLERMTPTERFEHQRNAQAQAAREGSALPVPPAPAPVTVAPDPASMTAAQRWAHCRNFDQTKMPAWKNPRG